MRCHGVQKLRIIRRKVSVADTPSLSALLFAHVFEKCVDFVEEALLLDATFLNAFPEFRNLRIIRTRMHNADDMAA